MENVHEKEKPCKCTICGRSYSAKASLNRHFQSEHENRKPHKCPICEYKSSKNSTLMTHIQSVHEMGNHINAQFVTIVSQ